jgi:hypothetical protein
MDSAFDHLEIGVILIDPRVVEGKIGLRIAADQGKRLSDTPGLRCQTPILDHQPERACCPACREEFIHG